MNDELEIKRIIALCDTLIHEERFDDLVTNYTEDAVLVIKPELEARGREQIKQAFIKIAAYFGNTLKPVEGKMQYIIAGDTALVLAQTFIQTSAEATAQSEFANERRATYIFKKIDGRWLCAIDNSYGTSLLDD